MGTQDVNSEELFLKHTQHQVQKSHHRKGAHLSYNPLRDQSAASIAARRLFANHSELVKKYLAKDALAKAAVKLRKDVIDIETSAPSTWKAFLEASDAYERFSSESVNVNPDESQK